MQIETTTTDDPALREAILDILVAYNDQQTGPSAPARTWALLLRDAGGAVAGGMWTVSYWGWMHVDLFFVPEGRRGAGLGGRMMVAAENEAARQGSVGIWLDTASYQAPDFYPRHGFRRYGTIENYVPPHARHWFLKTPLAIRPVDAAGFEASEAPAREDRMAINRALLAHSDAIAGAANFRTWAILLRGPDGAVEGGMWTRLGRGWMFVELFVLPAASRGQGLGTRLMRMAEDHARAEGCRGMWLDTSTFQARPFYEKLGFSVFGQIDGQPPGYVRYFLHKRFDT